MPSRTGPTSAPARSARPAISLANEILSARKALARVLDELGFLERDEAERRVEHLEQLAQHRLRAGIGGRRMPDDDPVGRQKSASAEPWRRNSGIAKKRGASPTAPSRSRRSQVPTGRVLRTTTIGVGSRVASSARTTSTAPASAWPLSSIGVPTQMRTISAVVFAARSRIVRSPDASAALSASWTPRSVNGTRPRRSASRRSGSVSTSSTGVPHRGEADSADEAHVPSADDGDRPARHGLGNSHPAEGSTRVFVRSRTARRGVIAVPPPRYDEPRIRVDATDPEDPMLPDDRHSPTPRITVIIAVRNGARPSSAPSTASSSRPTPRPS